LFLILQRNMQISSRMVSSVLLTVLLVVVTVATPGAGTAVHKRSCQHFCNAHTGLSGIVGGCRCSLTLFTKRALAPSLDIDGAGIMAVANEPTMVQAQAIKRAPLMNNDNDDTLDYTLLAF
ncbi:unnamed protein product, partial [Meganyctiphanes norvegica]